MAPPAENVKVAVRVRPLNSAEIEARCRTVSHQVRRGCLLPAGRDLCDLPFTVGALARHP